MIALVLAAAALASADGPEISSSRGKKDGVVVLAPRVVPASADDKVTEAAMRVRQKIADAAVVQYGAPYVDVRPAPERVCPVAGCRAASIGVMIGHQDGGCVALGIVGPPGAVDQRLVPLVGKFDLASDVLPFRQTPESKVIVREFVPCGQLDELLTPELVRALVPPRDVEP